MAVKKIKFKLDGKHAEGMSTSCAFNDKKWMHDGFRATVFIFF